MKYFAGLALKVNYMICKLHNRLLRVWKGSVHHSEQENSAELLTSWCGVYPCKFSPQIALHSLSFSDMPPGELLLRHSSTRRKHACALKEMQLWVQVSLMSFQKIKNKKRLFNPSNSPAHSHLLFGSFHHHHHYHHNCESNSYTNNCD